MNEGTLGPAVSMAHLKPGEACVVVLDCTGQMFVRAATETDIIDMIRDASDGD